MDNSTEGIPSIKDEAIVEVVTEGKLKLNCKAIFPYVGKGNRELQKKHSYDYDSQNRLVKAVYPTYTESFYYDRAGNRNRYVASPIHSEGSQGYHTDNIEVNYLYGVGNRLIEMTTKQNQTEEVTQFEYDKNGNLLKDGRARYNYDSFNRLERVETFDGHIQVNRYDGEGLRHEIEENGALVQFIYSGSEVVVETEKENRLTRYIRGCELISADSEKARNYYHYCNDELGSVTHILDEEGQVLNRYDYDAFGNTVLCEESVSNRFRFTGQQYDSITEQYYLRARYYNPVIGRFIQEDTYYGDGLNLYAYCENNPVRYVDPSGYTKVEAFEKPNGDQQVHSTGNEPKRMTWNEFQHANKGKYTKAEMSAAWADYKKSFAQSVPNSTPSQGSNNPYDLLKKRGIHTTLSDAEIDAANAVDLRMQAQGGSSSDNRNFKTENPVQTNPKITYGELDELGRPTGASAIITEDMIKTGTPANPNILPPGFEGGGPDSPGHARGHLIGNQ